MPKNQKGKLQNVENYKTSKTTERQNIKCWILQNGAIQNVESYRTAKDKMTNPTERWNKKHWKYETSKIKSYIGLYMKIIYLYSATNWTI
jgi:hypothetical protein